MSLPRTPQCRWSSSCSSTRRKPRLTALCTGRAGRTVFAVSDELLDQAARRSPEHTLVSIEEIGAVAAGLVSDLARGMAGNMVFVDAGYPIMG